MLTPLKDSIIVRQDKTPEKIGRIFIPEYARLPMLEGEVLAISKRHTAGLKPGDRIVFEPHSALEIKPLGKGVVIMREKDVLAVLEK